VDEGPKDPAPQLSGRPTERPSVPQIASNGRVLFAALWILVQLALVVTADHREGGAFGFRMFSESSTIKLSLYREVHGARIHVEGGAWNARASDGTMHRVNWYDRVPSPYWVFDQEMHASYGAKTQLARLSRALDDVAAHIPHDDETGRLVLDVWVRRNGREAVLHTLVSRPRAVTRGEP
jgi:hypothetical protein